MRNLFAFLLFLICSASAIAQAPAQVLEAAHCLLKMQFLDTPQSATIRLGYFLDSTSYPGKAVIYVTVYPKRTLSQGFVFAVFLEHEAGRLTYDIQNNASFIRSPQGIDFPGPPLGGTWTQQHLMAGIRHAAKGPIFPLGVNDLLAPEPGINCAAYTDPQPSHP